MKVYVAGPYAACTDNERLMNIQRARAVAADIWRNGHFAFCPHMNTAFMSGVAPESVFYDGALAFMLHCDAIVTVEGWRESRGTQAELTVAKDREMLIYHSVTLFLEAHHAGPYR